MSRQAFSLVARVLLLCGVTTHASDHSTCTKSTLSTHIASCCCCCVCLNHRTHIYGSTCTIILCLKVRVCYNTCATVQQCYAALWQVRSVWQWEYPVDVVSRTARPQQQLQSTIYLSIWQVSVLERKAKGKREAGGV